MQYKSIFEFDKDLKKLLKKFRTLREDIEVAKTGAIELLHLLDLDNNSVFQIPGFVFENVQILKLKKFSSKSLKGKGVQSGIRIIYAFYPQSLVVEFIEIYYKPEQENENRDRIKKYLNGQNI